MPLWVKVSGDAVVQCWDTPPPSGEEGWRDAIEVRPPVTAYREVYGQHYFDLTKTPVEIVWPVEAVSIEDRKADALNYAKFLSENGEPGTFETDFDPVAAQALYIARVAAIEAAQTHDALDAVP
jgi:hypothetical protein